MFFQRIKVLLLAAFLIGFHTIASAQTLPSYTAGVMAKSYDEKRARVLEKYEEIIGKYMEEKAGIKIYLKALTYPDLMKAVEKGTIDFIWGYGLDADRRRRPFRLG